MGIQQEYLLSYDVNKGAVNSKDMTFNIGDENTCRITFLIQKGLIDEDITGYSARAYFISPSNKKNQYDVIVEENKVIVDLPTSVLSEIGYYRLQVIVFDIDEKKAIMEVEYSVRGTLEGSYEEALNEPSLITQLENKINDRYTKAEVDTKFENLGEISSQAPIIFSPTNPMKPGYFWVKTQEVI